ncbi:MmgE/PrpD family protein [Achromobacter aloeverae]
MSNVTLSRVLAGFSRGLAFGDIPADVVLSAKLHLLDTLGTALAGTHMPYARAMLNVVGLQGRSEQATLLDASPRTSTAAWAAAYNASLSHANDFDDTHSKTLMHISSVVAPAAIAAGELRSAGGKDVLCAAVAGYETGLAIGLTAPAKLNVRGFHATSVIGVFASAVTTAKLLGLGVEETMHAIGIAGSQASGLIEFLAPDGAWTKRLQPGWAAYGGVIAGQLAAEGFTGPATILEGRFGAIRSFANVPPPSAQDFGRALGQTWETLDITFKPYPCCHISHAYVDCALALGKEHTLTPENIESIELRVAPGMVPILCEPAAEKLRPGTAYSSQFSLPFIVAAAIAFGRVGIGEFSDENIRDERLLGLAARVRYVVDETLPYPEKFPGWIEIRLRDGRTVQARRDQSRGSREAPLTEAELRQKFLANACKTLPREQAHSLWDCGMELENVADIHQLTRLFNVS